MKNKILLIIFLISALINFKSYADDTNTQDEIMLKQVKNFLELGDIKSAAKLINLSGDDLKVAKTYSNLVKNFYWEDKGAKNLIVVGNLGIDYCFKKAELENSLEKKNEFLSWAKTMAYDVGANTWPYWGDEGVVISKKEMQEGLKASELNLKLGLELKKPQDKIALAYWLIGVHQLVQKNFELTISNLTQSKNISLSINDELSANLADGYIFIAKIVLNNEESQKPALDLIIKKLKEINSEDSNFYASQLETAFNLAKSIGPNQLN